MNSIHRFAHAFIEEFMKLSLPDTGLSLYLEQAEQLFRSHLLLFVSEQISECDELLCQQSALRPDWQVVKGPVDRTLETKIGTLSYSRRYYRHKQRGEHAYLLDLMLGVRKYTRLDDGLLAALASGACTNSYQRVAQEEAGGRVSRMSVLKAVRTLKVPVPDPIEPRRVCKELHLQADEDHVHLQRSSKRSGQVRLVAFHEPKVEVGLHRYTLPRRELLSSVGESSERFWWRVLDRLEASYDVSHIERFYLHGDGGSWIKAGLDILPNCTFILDGFHLERELRRLCGGDNELVSRLRNCLHPWDERELRREVQILVDSCICTDEQAKKSLRYLCHQREGIKNYYTFEHGGSCAEGLVSHALSKRFSRDPMGWSLKSLRCLSELRMYQLNGGVIDSRLLKREVEEESREEWESVRSYLGESRQKTLPQDWSIRIPGTGNTGSALGAWMKGIQRGGFIH